MIIIKLVAYSPECNIVVVYSVGTSLKVDGGLLVG
jgi:hypothetical protein